ncbi:MAG: hypothetical protein QM234_08335 [Acidobacteriota bacterium]|nr:hypothetical protein [Acidobacteriota bacterium]
MSYAIITEVHTLDDALFEKVFLNEAPRRVAATVAACLLQATNTTNCDKADEIRRLVADLCHDNEAGDDIIAIANQIQELRNWRQAAKKPGYKGQ